MIEIAKVVKVEKNSIIVNVQGTAACSTCPISGACSLSSNNKTLIPKPKDMEFDVGDYIEFQMPEHVGATKIAMLLYGIPLVIFIGGAITLIDLTRLGSYLSLAFSLAGAGFYYWLLNRYSKKHSDKFAPYVVRKIDPPVAIDFGKIGDLR